MNRRLRMCLDGLRRAKRKALVAYVTGGYPDLGFTEMIVPRLAGLGVDIVEIGIPFSDPVADGPTIQFASDQALKNKVSMRDILRSVRRIRARTDVPVLLMSYLNPIYRHGLAATVAASVKAGADGFIIPDVIPEESAGLRNICRRNGASLVYLAAPTTSPARMRAIDDRTDSFVYIVSVTGVTGGRARVAAGIDDFLDSTRRNMAHPRMVGFGISSPAHVRALKGRCDGVIVGSALIELIRDNHGAVRLRKMDAFIGSLRKALDE